MRRFIFTLIMSFSFISIANGADAPQPCGPASQLTDEFSTNVADQSRCFELRMYTATPQADGSGGIDMLHQRFREKEIEIFEKLGAEILAVWQRLDDPNTLVWMLAYRDRAHREEVWTAFRTDEEWIELRAKYNVPITADTFMMSATDYSKLK